MFYAIDYDTECQKTLVLFESRSERDAYVRRHWKNGASEVTCREARRWSRYVKYIDTNGTDPLGWLGRGGYPTWLDDAIDRADHAYGAYDSPVYVMA